MPALDRGEHALAKKLLAAMGTELRSHWQGEEKGIFAMMGREELYAEHIPLVQEHRELEELLRIVDLTDADDRDVTGD